MDRCINCSAPTTEEVRWAESFMKVPREPRHGYVWITDLLGTHCTSCGHMYVLAEQIQKNHDTIEAQRPKISKSA